METFYEATPGLLKKSAIALGFFDGVHHGHQVVIGKAVEEAKRLGVTAGVVTFKDHPRSLTRGAAPLLLTMIEQRLELFERLGVEATLVLSFTEDLCRLSPREYVENILVGSMGAKSISVGYNHHFGKDREGDASLLGTMGKQLDFCVFAAPMVLIDGEDCSSSRIRELVSGCKVEEATRVLSRPYALIGEVVRGEGRGRKLGFPTANMAINEYQLVPGRGVYAGVARLADGRKLPSVINVGFRPTFKPQPGVSESGGAALLVEVHILDFDENLYNSTIQVDFNAHLRSEQKFDGVDALRAQIAADCNIARALLNQSNDGMTKDKLPA
ncbi:MAG: bifunctional riboflavin kinase/FAD synthetase [Candidatus Obscuribacterales bacterium]|nr:bifunctional riboflavin kinase/FAD synthetase [Cyanobacteria bacterium SZAS LIN-5]